MLFWGVFAFGVDNATLRYDCRACAVPLLRVLTAVCSSVALTLFRTAVRASSFRLKAWSSSSDPRLTI